MDLGLYNLHSLVAIVPGAFRIETAKVFGNVYCIYVNHRLTSNRKDSIQIRAN